MSVQVMYLFGKRSQEAVLGMRGRGTGKGGNTVCTYERMEATGHRAGTVPETGWVGPVSASYRP